MIKAPTVLILGAGASAHLGYPLGGALKDEIVGELQNTAQPVAKALLSLGYSMDMLAEFRVALGASGKPSVDAFLEHRGERFTPIGKAAIAAALVKYERLQNLRVSRGNWYELLYGRMNAKFEEFKENQLKIVTFNYDRSLEQYLHDALTYSYGRGEAETVAALRTLPIIHVHGQLGQLPWQEKDGRLYAPTDDPSLLKKAAEDIKIVSEAAMGDPEFEAARLAIQRADRVVFLGFGYGKANVERLMSAPIRPETVFYGSCTSMLNVETAEATELLKPRGLILGRNDWDIHTYLRTAVAL